MKMGLNYEPETEVYDGDSEDNDEEDDESYCNDKEFFNYERKHDIRLIERDFTNLGYIGFDEGIDLDSLDNTGNW